MYYIVWLGGIVGCDNIGSSNFIVGTQQGLKTWTTKRGLDLVEQNGINNNIEMRTLNNSPLEIQEFKSTYKGAINVEYKMNNPSCDMMSSNDHQQTTSSRETRSSSNPTTSMSSSFSSIVWQSETFGSVTMQWKNYTTKFSTKFHFLVEILISTKENN